MFAGNSSVVDRIAVLSSRTKAAKDEITGFTEKKLLGGVTGTLGHHLTTLTSHEVQQLVDQKGRRKSHDASTRQLNQLTAYRTSKAVACWVSSPSSRCYVLKAYSAQSVRTRQ